MSPDGRRTNNRQKRKRLPSDQDLVGPSRGTQAGTLRNRGKVSPIVRAGLLTDAEMRSGVLDETATFFDRLRDKIRRRDR